MSGLSRAWLPEAETTLDHSGKRARVTRAKSPRLSELPAEGEGNLDHMVEDGGDKIHGGSPDHDSKRGYS